MPFRSRAQERWAFATGQPFAEEWAAMTPKAGLPKRVKPKPKARKAAKKK